MNGLNQYRSYQVETVSPEDQIVLLYEGAKRFIDRAVMALEAQEYRDVSLNVGKAQQILAELSGALNFEAGEIAENLYRLYEYWSWRLSQGLIKKEVGALKEVSAAVGDMTEAWAEAARQVRTQRATRSLG